MSDIFIKGTRNGVPFSAGYKGMDLVTVNSLATDLGVTGIQAITEQEFKDILAASESKPKSQVQIDTEQAVAVAKADLQSKAKTADERIDALIKVLGL